MEDRALLHPLYYNPIRFLTQYMGPMPIKIALPRKRGNPNLKVSEERKGDKN